jgi:hypothetical protein
MYTLSLSVSSQACRLQTHERDYYTCSVLKLFNGKEKVTAKVHLYIHKLNSYILFCNLCIKVRGKNLS